VLGLPKELLPLGGKPLLGHALEESARAGFEAATVVISPSKTQVRDYLANARLPIPVETVIQPEPRGVGDAVLRGWRGQPIGVLLPDDVVLATDHWQSLLALHLKEGSAALCVREVAIETADRFGIAECNGDKVVGLAEKPPPGTAKSNLAIFGRYVVTDAVITGLSNSKAPGELELTYGFAAALAGSPGVRAVHFRGEIYDCGTPGDYALSISRFPG
jgi:UTP--glucose-1-phosphate uridylyltransferase